MGKRKIIWSQRANIKLFEILEFYTKRNVSTIYSQKLYITFKKELLRLIKQPEIGIKTEEEGVRGLIVEKFILFYEITAKTIIVLTVWDCRQNPDDLIIK
jgi:plasmid stabilization system protein ParE